MDYVKYVPLTLFSVYALKCLMFPTTFVEGAILLVLGSVAGYYEYKEQNKELKKFSDESAELAKRLTHLENAHADLKHTVSTTKFTQQIRGVGVGNVPR